MRVQTNRSLDIPLMLVNAQHPIQGQWRPDLVPVDDRCPEIRLERRAAGLLSACIRAVGGQGEIVPVSGWRSRQEQQTIWDDTLKKEGEGFTRQYVALPGCSEHETGLAIDLGLVCPHIDFIRPDFPNWGVCAAFRRRAADYGFILRYPAGKENITGIAHEPWHFRYVGVPHAQIMAKQGLTLEEYLELVHSHSKNDPLYCQGMGCRFQIYAQEGDRPDTHWTEEGWRVISQDNCGGWIVTAWQVGRC